MKKIYLFLFVFFNLSIATAQPAAFTWTNSSGTNYISPAKDQCEMGPCSIFATVAAVEAMSHIYYNKPFSVAPNILNLAEAEIYSGCGGYGRFDAAPGIESSLMYIDTAGIIDEACFEFPDSCFRTDCGNICGNPDYVVNIPGYEQIYPGSNQDLKRAIIDYGPIAVTMQNVGGALHTGGGTTTHSVVIIGWSSSAWHIKDSWPGDAYIAYKNIDVFNASYQSIFFRVKYKNSGNYIICSGSGCSLFSSRRCVDSDGDGFYYWGIGDKPTGCPGPCKMDFNDADPDSLFLDDDYEEVPAPYITGPDLICGTDSILLNNAPDGFDVEWAIIPIAHSI